MIQSTHVQPLWTSAIARNKNKSIEVSVFPAMYRGNPEGQDSYDRKNLLDAKAMTADVSETFFAQEKAQADGLEVC